MSLIALLGFALQYLTQRLKSVAPGREKSSQVAQSSFPFGIFTSTDFFPVLMEVVLLTCLGYPSVFYVRICVASILASEHRLHS